MTLGGRGDGLGIRGEGLGIGERNQRLKCKMQNCGGHIND